MSVKVIFYQEKKLLCSPISASLEYLAIVSNIKLLLYNMFIGIMKKWVPVQWNKSNITLRILIYYYQSKLEYIILDTIYHNIFTLIICMPACTRT